MNLFNSRQNCTRKESNLTPFPTTDTGERSKDIYNELESGDTAKYS
jgi:hypothetical protein